MGNEQFRRWGERNAPCCGCQDRCIGCHGQDANGLYKCERYGEFKAQQEVERQARREYIKQTDEVFEVIKSGRRRGKWS